MTESQWKNLKRGQLLIVARLTEDGNYTAKMRQGQSGYDRFHFREIGFIGQVSSHFVYREIYLTLPNIPSIIEKYPDKKNLPASVFLWNELEQPSDKIIEEYASKEEIAKLVHDVFSVPAKGAHII
jgi:hypothetical protein